MNFIAHPLLEYMRAVNRKTRQKKMKEKEIQIIVLFEK